MKTFVVIIAGTQKLDGYFTSTRLTQSGMKITVDGKKTNVGTDDDEVK